MAMGTFLNPAFMKETIKTESNTVVISQHGQQPLQPPGHDRQRVSSDEKNLISDDQARAKSKT
jgi:hypothetical protein